MQNPEEVHLATFKLDMTQSHCGFPMCCPGKQVSRHITTVEVKLQKLNNFWKTGRLKLVVKNLIITEYQLFSRNMNFCIIYVIINIEMK